MKGLRLASLALALTLGAGGSAWASAELARAKNCNACHAPDKKLIGPSYRDIAARYATDKDAVAKLVGKTRQGGVGVWGQIPMPANPQVNADEATALVRWILGHK
ncbi:MAG TPA: c-type cytochrome [Burkholderiaceae bacterium]|jgi:cytochrome c|nr:c-type cytochrome [Burkholderiaceae bacterium]